MHRPHFLFLLAALLAAITALGAACKSSEKMQGDPQFRSITIQQGGCFGTCPVFTMAITPAGTIDYDGQQYAPYHGLHHGQISADTLALIRRLAGQVLAKADQLPKRIETGVMDYSEFQITIVAPDGDSLAYSGNIEFAAPVAALKEALLRVPQHTEMKRDPKAGPLPADQLLVTLKTADYIQPLTENYYRQQLKVVRLTSKEPPVFLLEFDPYTMSAEEMERDLRRNPVVVKVEIVERVN